MDRLFFNATDQLLWLPGQDALMLDDACCCDAGCVECLACNEQAPPWVDADIPAGSDLFGLACCLDIAGLYRLPHRADLSSWTPNGLGPGRGSGECVFRLDFAEGEAVCDLAYIELIIARNTELTPEYQATLEIYRYPGPAVIARWARPSGTGGSGSGTWTADDCYFDNFEIGWGSPETCFSFLHQPSAFLHSTAC